MNAPTRTPDPGLGTLAFALGAAALCFAVAGGPARAQSFPEGGDPPQIEGGSEAHAVAPGDTLWDLCSKHLNSPWYWPKIWSYNPQLTNPHWIFPGNEVRFYPGDEQLPTMVDVGRSLEVDDDDLVVPGSIDPDDLVKTVGTIEVGKVVKDSVWSAFTAYVSRQTRQRSGRVIGSLSEAIMIMENDRIYIQGGEHQVGEKLAVFRDVRTVVHPITGERFGLVVQLVGAVEVVALGDSYATGRIERAYRPIERGDFVAAWPERFGARVQPVAAATEAKGYIIETASDVLSAVGEHDMVFIDRGRKHGVVRGNVFDIFHRGDRYTYRTAGFPNERVGQVMVIEVEDDVSTGIVTASLFEMVVGDKVELQQGR